MKRFSGKWLALLFLLPFAAFFVIFQIAPLAWVALNSLKASDAWSLANYLELFGSPFYRQAIRHSLEIAGWSSLLGLLIAVLGSHSLRHVDSRLRDFVMAFSNMTSNFAGVPLAFAFIILLGFNGALTLLLKQAGWIDDFNLYSKTGLIILYTYFQIPLGVMLLYPAFDALREDWRESAALLGANGWQMFWHVTLPNIKWGLIYGVVLCTARAMGEFGAVSVVSGHIRGVTNTLPLHVEILYNEYNHVAAFSVASLLLLMALVILLLKQWSESRMSRLKSNADEE